MADLRDEPPRPRASQDVHREGVEKAATPIAPPASGQAAQPPVSKPNIQDANNLQSSSVQWCESDRATVPRKSVANSPSKNDDASKPARGKDHDHMAPGAKSDGQPRQNSSRHNHSARRHATNRTTDSQKPVYGALDLGTNNCRLLLARPSRRGFRVIDAFSRIIRLGEGVARSGELSPAAIDRALDALKVCASKMNRSRVARARLVATQACRIATNADVFLDTVRESAGLDIEILTQEDEARLAVSGCASLIDVGVDFVLVFDIGGGSSELIWLDLSRRRSKGRTAFVDRLEAQDCMVAWTSLPVGVVTLAEHFGGTSVVPEQFEEMVSYVEQLLAPFEAEHKFRERTKGTSTHLLGTSGTITTIAGIKLGLRRYDRSKVDGCWLDVNDAQSVTDDLLAQTHDERVAEPCIGAERADLVLAGCAILEGLLRTWPSERMRVADRGLREGILATLMSEDGVYRTGRGRGGQRHRPRE